MRSFSQCRAAVHRRFSAGRRIPPLLFSPVHDAPGRGCMLSLSRHPHLYMDFQTVPVCFSAPESAGSTHQSDARPLHLLLRDGRGLRRKRMSSYQYPRLPPALFSLHRRHLSSFCGQRFPEWLQNQKSARRQIPSRRAGYRASAICWCSPERR